MNRFFTFLIILNISAGLLSGCSGNELEEIAATPPASVSAGQPVPNSEPANETVEAELSAEHYIPGSMDEKYGLTSLTDVSGSFTELSLPLTDEVVTLSIMMPYSAMGLDYLPTYNDHVVWNYAQAVTGVTIDWTEVPSEAADEKFALMIVAGEWVDLLYDGPSKYTGGAGLALEEGVFIDITDYLNYCPNYDALRKLCPEYIDGTSVTGGGIPAFFTLFCNSMGQDSGILYRQDYLDTLGADIPTDYDELYDLLTLAKNTLDKKYTLFISAAETGQLAWGYNINADLTGNGMVFGQSTPYPAFVADGVVYMGWMTDEYHDYISMLAKWYQEGLIYSEFYIDITDGMMGNNLLAGDDWFMTANGVASLFGNEETSENPNYKLTAGSPIMMREGDAWHLGNEVAYVSTEGIAISTQCKNPEIAVSFMDFWYSETGCMLANFGVEGNLYTDNADGSIDFTELYLDNPNNWRSFEVQLVYTGQGNTGTGTPSLYDYARDMCILSNREVSAIAIWNENVDDAYVYPSAITFSPEESELLKTLYTDANTYVSEFIYKYIKAEATDEQWSRFQEELTIVLRLDEVLKIYQAAFDEYTIESV